MGSPEQLEKHQLVEKHLQNVLGDNVRKVTPILGKNGNVEGYNILLNDPEPLSTMRYGGIDGTRAQRYGPNLARDGFIMHISVKAIDFNELHASVGGKGAAPPREISAAPSPRQSGVSGDPLQKAKLTDVVASNGEDRLYISLEDLNAGERTILRSQLEAQGIRFEYKESGSFGQVFSVDNRDAVKVKQMQKHPEVFSPEIPKKASAPANDPLQKAWSETVTTSTGEKKVYIGLGELSPGECMTLEETLKSNGIDFSFKQSGTFGRVLVVGPENAERIDALRGHAFNVPEDLGTGAKAAGKAMGEAEAGGGILGGIKKFFGGGNARSVEEAVPAAVRAEGAAARVGRFGGFGGVVGPLIGGAIAGGTALAMGEGTAAAAEAAGEGAILSSPVGPLELARKGEYAEAAMSVAENVFGAGAVVANELVTRPVENLVGYATGNGNIVEPSMTSQALQAGIDSVKGWFGPSEPMPPQQTAALPEGIAGPPAPVGLSKEAMEQAKSAVDPNTEWKVASTDEKGLGDLAKPTVAPTQVAIQQKQAQQNQTGVA